MGAPGGGTATLCFAAGHPAAAGHFPGDPIIPGAVLLRDIATAIGVSGQCGIRSAKFHQPVRPGDTVVMRWEVTAGGDVRFWASAPGADRPAVTGVLRPRQP